MELKRPSLLLPIALAICTAAVFSGRAQSRQPAFDSGAQASLAQSVHAPARAERCRFCHAAEVEGYARSAMAHSLRRAAREPDGSVATADAKITIHSSPTGYWQQLQSGSDVTDYRIGYVIGSGNHAAGYLLDLAGHLYQSPVAYYKSHHGYDLAPGYEGSSNPDFTRPVAEACLFCHSGTALKIPGTSNEYQSPPFSAEAITCERCHGSAEKHLSDPRVGTIINPAKLEIAARDSVCEQCHLLGVGRVLNPGKKFSDFYAGEPLEDVFTTYVNVLPPDAPDTKFKVISHVEQLARSMCARKSNGRLWCGSCHDPHHEPLEPVQYFRTKCLSCHTKNFAPAHPDRESNCISCHMPRRDAKDGGHTAFTDHRIQRRPASQEVPPAENEITAWREPAPELQKRNLGIAYINAGMERHSRQFIGQGYRMLTEVQDQFANDSDFFSSIGTALLVAKQSTEAEFAFERALQLNPNSVTAETNAASAYQQAGDVDRTRMHLERAVALDPLHLPADFPLIEIYKQQGDRAKAEEISNRLNAAMQKQAAGIEGPLKVPVAKASPATEAAFKNIQVLKDVSWDQLIPAMEFISASLGVECSYCHVERHFEKDDKKPKQIARDMMRMMLAIDKDSFAGNREVTCYSCHRGSLKPEGMPAVSGEAAARKEATHEEEKLSANLPTADRVIENYIQALGGAEAIEKVTSREAKGTTTLDGKSVPVEIFNQDPGKQALIQHMPAGDSSNVFNGREGWISMPGRPMHEMRGADLDAAAIDADLHFPLHINQKFAELRVEYPEKIEDREFYVISCSNVGEMPVKLYFDEQTRLLARLVRYAASPLGIVPTQTDYADYRDVDGVKIPFRWTISQPNKITLTQLELVQQNIPIDDAKFATPAPTISITR